MDPLQVASLQSSSRKEGILVPPKTFWNVGFHAYWISGCKKIIWLGEVARLHPWGGKGWDLWMLNVAVQMCSFLYGGMDLSLQTLFQKNRFVFWYLYILIRYLQQLNWCLVGCFSLVASAQDWWIYIDSRCTTYRELSVEGWEQHRQHRR